MLDAGQGITRQWEGGVCMLGTHGQAVFRAAMSRVHDEYMQSDVSMVWCVSWCWGWMWHNRCGGWERGHVREGRLGTEGWCAGEGLTIGLRTGMWEKEGELGSWHRGYLGPWFRGWMLGMGWAAGCWAGAQAVMWVWQHGVI